MQSRIFLPTEGCRNADDQSLAFGAQLFEQVDLVPRRIFNKNIEIWNLITSTDQGGAGSVESRYFMKGRLRDGSRSGKGTRE